MSVTGTLPAGYRVIVLYHGLVFAVLGPTGGSFSGITEAKGFGAATDVDSFACKGAATVGQPGPSACLAERADVGLYWSP